MRPYRRIIPADAGSTWKRTGLSRCPWDHPRGCGEHILTGLALSKRGGSSPRMRGAPRTSTPCQAGGRIIPADAGSTSYGSGSPKGKRIIPADAGSTLGQTEPLPADPDHPRGCGEHSPSTVRACLGSGSSPRMRGARRVGCTCCGGNRIIPADAGSTRHHSSSRRKARDHPRGCGEHDLTAFCKSRSKGSSPRMRGAPESYWYYDTSDRIIPADAGST